MSILRGKNNSMRCKAVALLINVLLFMMTIELWAQEPPPRPLVVTKTKDLLFGAFSHGITGGTVTVSPASIRTGTIDIILLNLGYTVSAAEYRLVASPGKVVSLLNGPDVSLTGSNGGSMILHIGNSSPVSPFVITTTPPNYTVLTVGGSLTVGNSAANPPGNYSGTFNITFIQG
jgi:hypothetical protein